MLLGLRLQAKGMGVNYEAETVFAIRIISDYFWAGR